MDLYLVVLRNIHFFAGIFWVGTTLFMAFMLVPAANAIGLDGQRYMRSLYGNTFFTASMPIAALLTTLAGILLWIRVSDNFNADYMGSPSGIVLSTGALFGILAFGHGGAAITRYSGKHHKALEAAFADGTVTPEEEAEIMELNRKVRLHVNISLGLMIIAVIGMASARYVS